MSDLVPITSVTPEHPKNWFTDLFVYVITLLPEINVPVTPNPIVESTAMTEDPIETELITLVFGWIVKLPSIKSFSSYPTNNPIL